MRGISERASAELERKCMEVLGKNEMVMFGGRWRARIEENPDKLRRVLDDIAATQREGKVIAKPGAYAEDLWKRFA